MKTFKAIGLMSGTSMDGIDGVICDTDGISFLKPISNYSIDYSMDFQKKMKELESVCRENNGDMEVVKKLYPYADSLIQQSTDFHIKVAKMLMENSGINKVDIVGYHGQALFHKAKSGISIQVGDAVRMAKELKTEVISDFRMSDIKKGGQGAPLAPVYHQMLTIRDKLAPALVINCGGIANVSYIKGPAQDEVWGFDSGPGNVMVDSYIRLKTNNNDSMDRDGKYGSKGNVQSDLLKVLYSSSCKQDNYFTLLPPKSLDAGDFILPPQLDDYRFEDAVKTLEHFTARTIYDSLKLLKFKISNIILAGGGWNNPVILGTLTDLMPGVKIQLADSVGWSMKYMEAELFAFIAVRKHLGLPVTFPQTTGCHEPVVCGTINKF